MHHLLQDNGGATACRLVLLELALNLQERGQDEVVFVVFVVVFVEIDVSHVAILMFVKIYVLDRRKYALDLLPLEALYVLVEPDEVALAREFVRELLDSVVRLVDDSYEVGFPLVVAALVPERLLEHKVRCDGVLRLELVFNQLCVALVVLLVVAPETFVQRRRRQLLVQEKQVVNELLLVRFLQIKAYHFREREYVPHRAVCLVIIDLKFVVLIT